MPRKKKDEQKSNSGMVDQDTEKLNRLQSRFDLWARTTQSAREAWRRDYEMVEGGGKQNPERAKRKVLHSGRPLLEYNRIQPQVMLLAGMMRQSTLDFIAMPRGLEDRRLGEIATACLKAASDFGRFRRVTDQVTDDAIICGIGVWEVLHSFEDAEDIIWGDIQLNRIDPMSFIFDPWAVEPDLQDGSFMGKATWLPIDVFKETYPDHRHLANPGDWPGMLASTQYMQSSDMGLPEVLEAELFDHENGRIRVLTMWEKVPKTIDLVVDTQTGQVIDVDSKAAGEQMLADIEQRTAGQFTGRFEIISQDNQSLLVDTVSKQPIPAPNSGAPLVFANPEAADAHRQAIAERAGIDAASRLQILNRKARVPEWTDLVFWQELGSGPTPYKDRKFPFVPFIAKQFRDGPESIQGVVRPLWDPQLEYNKRRSNILAHLNSSAHSGWLNRTSGGANKAELEQVGSKPGVVVPYATVPPVQIRPVELSQGHFQMVQDSERQILAISGINADLIGFQAAAPSVVSGRAIRERKAGGATIQETIFSNRSEALLDVAAMVLRRVQVFYPPDKIKRIMGIAELNGPLGESGHSVFADPVTGQRVSDDQLIKILNQVRAHQFDLVFKLAKESPTERQAQFEQAVQLMGMITSTGKEIGPESLKALIDLAEMPTRLAKGLQADSQRQPDPAILAKGGQNDSVQGAISNIRGGRAGGNDSAQG